MSAGIPVIGGLFNAAAIDDETNATGEALLREQRIQEKNAEIAREAGAFNASRQQDEANKSFGATRADVGAAGISQDSGSVLDVLRQSHQNAELDRLSILHGSELDAINAENQADSLSKQRDSVFKSANNRKLASIFSGAGEGVKNLPNGGSNSGSNPKLSTTSGGSDYSTYNNSDYARA